MKKRERGHRALPALLADAASPRARAMLDRTLLIDITIADAFYTALAITTKTGDPILEFHEAGHALHNAVRTARDAHPLHPSLWAAYIHVGG